ncbi:MAG TPA: class I SAM-dependent methyltransferase family protein [Candidatus Acidoferrum sp.]|nr:class I SAM-dependent methyltransferase family protein [Candidatus Acidoferrum sp.]
MLKNCIKVPKLEGENTRRQLNDLGLLDKNYKIKNVDSYLYIPIRDVAEISEQFNFEKCDLLPLKKNPVKKIGVSYDVIGDIAVIDYSRDAQKIALDILKTRKHIKVVLAATSHVKGDYRLRDFVLMAGENRTETVHKEFGIKLFVDVSKAYFNPKLSTERNRVASLTRVDEIVIDMFAGIGPFTIMLSKRARKVIAMEINPDAFTYLKKNITLNKLKNVDAFLGDAKKLSSGFKGVANRIIMNLPHSAFNFLEQAAFMLSERGGTIHYYDIKEESCLPQTVGEIQKLIEKNGRSIENLNVKSVRSYAPGLFIIVMDITVAPLNFSN